MSARRALAAALLVPLALLSACTEDEPVPQMPDPTTSTPSPTDSSTAEPEAAEDFIRRWATAETDMERTGETDVYRELSATCRACTELADLVEGYYSAGGYVKWAGWNIRSVRPYPAGGESAFVVKVTSPPTKYKESKSGEVETFPGGPATHVLTLEAAGDSWVVADKAELQ